MSASADDEVVLVDDAGTPCGSAPRATVHTAETPLHQAFSLYLFDGEGQVLVTRRALGKATWSGVWTNACCGHPRPGEELGQAVRRRLHDELGVAVERLDVVLPDFRYQAVDASGVVEHELCPVLVGEVRGELHPDPEEVAEHAWLPWQQLVSAVAAAPRVWSPWAALQVPRLAACLPAGLPHTGTPGPGGQVGSEDTSADVTLGAVEQLLRTELAWTRRVWSSLAPAGPADVLGDEPGDLPQWLAGLLAAGGKRLRPRMCHWGFVAGGGRPGTPPHDDLVRVAAALEMLHEFALIHDDVMDQSEERRGRPAAHVVAASRHRAAQGHGDDSRFGENLALLLGDLAHSEADRLVRHLPAPLLDYWYELNLELIVGQRADLTGAAARRTDLAHSEAVAALKSGAYTIERPLQLGALAAGASQGQREVLARFGHHLGRAFAWRDDVLGVWGDHAVTGKPSGDDLREGKTTLIWVLGAERLSGAAAAAMARVGTNAAREEDVPLLQTALLEAGVRQEVEDRIAAEMVAAEASLDDGVLSTEGVEGLRATARAVAWRSS
ncbi:isopentenyl-diphosphate Delta-isomerase [Ornithinimicrobium tianjinense]|uniref:isopentenyl-diphosphate Delta-isomerase n=1 Tax=Ornithinimicrobium tianjinense TaxID=1195761 RepID=UPI001662BBE3|nr:isopentenyl-diphosphate Delta-isomerase [Ornithinimicrobium tianjinense]